METDGSEMVSSFERLPEGSAKRKSLDKSGAREDERHVDTVPAMRVWYEGVQAAQ